MARRRRSPPLVYLDACCFGTLVRRVPDPDNIAAMTRILHDIEVGLLAFLDSTWLAFELSRIRPAPVAKRLVATIPDSDQAVQWEGSLARDAARLIEILGMHDDPSAEFDCRHLACALRGGADFLVTEDKSFYEAMRQRILTIAPLKPLLLRDCRDGIHAD